MTTDETIETLMTKTTVKIEMTTRDRLAMLGRKNDSFDTIINKLLDEHEGKKITW
jgi:hypothetical protein